LVRSSGIACIVVLLALVGGASHAVPVDLDALLSPADSVRVEELDAEVSGHVEAERYAEGARAAAEIVRIYERVAPDPPPPTLVDLRATASRLARLAGAPDGVRAHYAAGTPLILRLIGLDRARDRAGMEAPARELVAHYRIALGADDPDLAWALYQLARSLSAQNRHDEAAEAAREALAIQDRAVPVPHPLTAVILNSLGSILLDLGDAEAALEVQRRTLDLRRELYGPRHPRVATGLSGMAKIIRQLGRYREALELHRESLSIRIEAHGADSGQAAVGWTNLGTVLDYLGRYTEAADAHRRALAIQEVALAADDPVLARYLGNAAVVAHNLGDLAESEALHRRALDITRNALGPDDLSTLRHLENLALVRADQGAFEEAEEMHREVLAGRSAALGPDHPQVASTLHALAVVLQRQGKIDEAERVLRDAVARWQETGVTVHPVAGAMAALGNLLWERGAYAEAESVLVTSRRFTAEHLDPEHPIMAAVHERLGRVYLATGRLDDAEAAHAEAERRRIALVGEDHPSTARSTSSLATCRFLLGRVDDAFADALDAERVSVAHLRAVAAASPERTALDYADIRVSGMDALFTIAAHDPDRDRIAATWGAVVSSRAAVLDEMATRHRSLADADDPEIARLLARWVEARETLANLALREVDPVEPGGGRAAADAYRRSLTEAREDKEALERELGRRSARFRTERARESVDLPAVLEALPSDAALVAFARYAPVDLEPGTASDPAEELVAFVARRGVLSLHPLGEVAAIAERVETWHEAASTPPGSSTSREDRTPGEELRVRIWDPVADAVGDARQVMVVPDGILNLASFAALPLPDGRFLAETGRAFAYLSAERDLVHDHATPPGEGLLAVGDPDFEAAIELTSRRDPASRATGPGGWVPGGMAPRRRGDDCPDLAAIRFGALPATREEVDGIAELWRDGHPRGSATLLLGAEATEAAIKAGAPGRRVLHLATHGFFLGARCGDDAGDVAAANGVRTRGAGKVAPLSRWQPTEVTRENPLLRAGLALAAANRREEAVLARDEDGILTAEEIAALDLRGVEWAVLSACDTGLGEVHDGEGVVGLRRAFEIAGVRSLVMSLWSVDDEATRDWMLALYAARDRSSSSAAEAVRSACRDVLLARRARGASLHPFYWAGFLATGG